MYDIVGINTFLFLALSIITMRWLMAQLRRSRDCRSQTQATGIPRLRDLSSELETVNTKWCKLGVYLDLEMHKLMQIELDHQGSERQMLQMLHLWLQCTPNAAWRDVVSALQKMGENKVAESIRENYMRGECTL